MIQKRTFRKQSMEEALVQSGQFDDIIGEIFDWMGAKLPTLVEECTSQKFLGDIETVKTLMNEHYKLNEEMDSRKPNIQAINERIGKIITSATEQDMAEYANINGNLERLNTEWKQMEALMAKRVRKIQFI